LIVHVKIVTAGLALLCRCVAIAALNCGLVVDVYIVTAGLGLLRCCWVAIASRAKDVDIFITGPNPKKARGKGY